MQLRRVDEFLRRRMAARRCAAALMAGEPRLLRADARAQRFSIRRPKADACILLWMAGGMAAPETFDPKRYSRSRSGCRSRRC